MKNIVLIFILFLFSFSANSQINRSVELNPYNGKLSQEFQEVFDFWESYITKLNEFNTKSRFLLKIWPQELSKYWSEDELENYRFPDLQYAFKRSYGNVFYPTEKEMVMGIVKMGQDHYELKTMFSNQFNPELKGFPSFMIKVQIKKTNDDFKLTNYFSYRNLSLKKKSFNNIIYYFPCTHQFNDSLANLLQFRVENFITGFKIENKPKIKYVMGSNMSEIADFFGVDYYDFEYLRGNSTIEGRAMTNVDMLLSSADENDFHEVIHILLAGIRKGRYNGFEEGIACYFGDHIGEYYHFHIKRVKDYLNNNPWIDLSGSLSGYYLDNEQIKFGVPPDDLEFITYSDEEQLTNIYYILHSAICDIAYRAGGYDKVKELLLCKADNETEFYQCIEDVLLIKRLGLNEYIRSFIGSHY